MIRKRCGVNLGRELLNQAKQIFEVHDFWRKISPLNRAIKKAAKGEWQKKRVIITEIETVKGLTSWLQRNKITAFFNPADEEIRREIVSPYACFFLFISDEYAKRQEIEDFQRIIKKLPKRLDLTTVSHDSQLSHDDVLNAFSEVNELPYCIRHIMEMKESTLVNLVISLILLKNYMEFCSEVMYCTEEKIEKCKGCLSKFSLTMKKEFFDLVRLNGIYYPLSLYMRHQFRENYIYIDITSYVSEFKCPLELAIFLHDAYQMGAVVYPGFGITTDIQNKPDAYLLDYIYPLEKSVPLKQVSALIFLSALDKTGDVIQDFLEDVKSRIKKLPLGDDVEKLVSKYAFRMNTCYGLW
ncbi:MAG: hypothetical protein OEZ40_11435, partial [Candidatus Bathyarchaeota archaeon]|nr:hypothetical protein [Candidatus Bathyarchaeota archaeon]